MKSKISPAKFYFSSAKFFFAKIKFGRADGMGIRISLQENILSQLFDYSSFFPPFLGYYIPKDTLVLWSTMIFQEQFPNYDQFVPERWLKGHCQNISPYSVRLFSHGPRMCIGKRFAGFLFN